jgi:DNA-binding transcriptional LysR family regulator
MKISIIRSGHSNSSNNMLTLEAIQLLDAISRRGSFALAAEELGKATSSLSYGLRKVEQELDVLLLDRSAHRAHLTPAGQVLLAEGLPLLRAASRLEVQVRQIAHGWESRVAIVLDALLPWAPLMALIQEFAAVSPNTSITLRQEVLAGNWDALLQGRADLVIGAPGKPPTHAGLRSRPLLQLPFTFAVAPHHPLSRAKEPVDPAAIQPYRAAAIADTAHFLPVRTVGLLPGQDVLSVPNLEAKLAAQCLGLCVGWLPEWLARKEIATGRLIEKQVACEKKIESMVIAWNSGAEGKAMQWFLKRLRSWDPLPGAGA